MSRQVFPAWLKERAEVMIAEGQPTKQIVLMCAEQGYTVTPQTISGWRTRAGKLVRLAKQEEIAAVQRGIIAALEDSKQVLDAAKQLAVKSTNRALGKEDGAEMDQAHTTARGDLRLVAELMGAIEQTGRIVIVTNPMLKTVKEELNGEQAE